MSDLSIGEAARRAGVMASTLRYYEEAGVLPVARRVAGRRRYDARLVKILEVIRFAQSAGFSLAEVKLLFNGFTGKTNFSQRWKALANEKLVQLDEMVRQAEKMKAAIREGLACGCVRVEDCLLTSSQGPAAIVPRATKSAKKGKA